MIERGPLGHPALDDGVAGPRARDRVDALADVVDLVDDVRPGVEEDRPEERRDERRPVRTARRPTASAAPASDRDDRRGEGERPEDLLERAEPPPGRSAPPSRRSSASVVVTTGAPRPPRTSADPTEAAAAARDFARRSPIRRSTRRWPPLDELVDLALLLEHRLEERQPEPASRRGRPSRPPRRPRGCRRA